MKTEKSKCMGCGRPENECKDFFDIEWDFLVNTPEGKCWSPACPIILLCDVCHDYVFMGDNKMAEHKLNAIVIKQKFLIGQFLN